MTLAGTEKVTQAWFQHGNSPRVFLRGVALRGGTVDDVLAIAREAGASGTVCIYIDGARYTAMLADGKEVVWK